MTDSRKQSLESTVREYLQAAKTYDSKAMWGVRQQMAAASPQDRAWMRARVKELDPGHTMMPIELE